MLTGCMQREESAPEQCVSNGCGYGLSSTCFIYVLQHRANWTWCLYDNFHLSWQGAAELTCFSWADIWVDKLHLSWHTTAQPTWCSWDEICHLRGERAQLNWHVATSWHVATELTAELTWLQLFWHVAGELTLTVPEVVQMVQSLLQSKFSEVHL